MLDPEFTMDAAAASLKGSLPAVLQYVNETRTDFATPIPDDESYTTGTDPVLRYPWIEISVVASDVTDLDVEQQEGDQRSTVIVACRYQHANGNVLDRALRRYAAAMTQVLMRPNAFGGHDTVEAIRIAYGTNPEFDEQQMLNGVTVCAFTVLGVAFTD